MTKLRMGLIGGGEGAFIGPVHRMAAELDGAIALVCGAFSSNPARSQQAGVDRYGLPRARSYESVTTLLAGEQRLPADQRVQFLTIATPNHSHAAIAQQALQAGLHVVCDKPLTATLADAEHLAESVSAAQRLFAVTYNYSGYPMVQEARALIAAGQLGPLRRVMVEYLQGWLATDLENTGQKQAVWRTDPLVAGAGSLGDIGTHAFHLLEHVSGQRVTALTADVHSFVKGRRVDDDASMLLRLNGGARASLSVSQIATGEENGLVLRAYGELGGLTWRQQEPNSLWLSWRDRPAELRRTGGPGLSEAAGSHTRLPSGHPEGFLEAFANIYRNFADHLQRWEAGDHDTAARDYPGIDDGLRGMRFIDAALRSQQHGWVDLA